MKGMRSKAAFLTILLLLLPATVAKGARAMKSAAASVFMEHIPKIWKLMPKMTLQQGADLWAGINAVLLAILAKDVLVPILDRVLIGMLDMNPDDAAVSKRRILRMALYTPTIGSMVSEMSSLDDNLEKRPGALDTIDAFKLDGASLTGAFLSIVELGTVIREHYLTRRAAKTFTDGVTSGDPVDFVSNENGDPIAVALPGQPVKSLYSNSDFMAQKLAHALIAPDLTGDIAPIEDVMMTRIPPYHINQDGDVEMGNPLLFLAGPAMKYLGKTAIGKTVMKAAGKVGSKIASAGKKAMGLGKKAAPYVGRTARDVTAFTALDMAMGAVLPGGPPPTDPGLQDDSLNPALINGAGINQPMLGGGTSHVNLPVVGTGGNPYTTPTIPIPTELVTALGLTSGDIGLDNSLRQSLLSGDIDDDPTFIFSDDYLVNDPMTLEIGGFFSGLKKGFKKLKKKISMENIGKGVKKAMANPLVNAALGVAGSFIPGVSAITGLLGAGGSPLETMTGESLQAMGLNGGTQAAQNSALQGIRSALGGGLGSRIKDFLAPGGAKSSDILSIARFINSPEFDSLVASRENNLVGQPIRTVRMSLPLNFRIAAEVPGADVTPSTPGSRVSPRTRPVSKPPRGKTSSSKLGIRSTSRPSSNPGLPKHDKAPTKFKTRSRRERVNAAFEELDDTTSQGDVSTGNEELVKIPASKLAGLIAAAYGDISSARRASKKTAGGRLKTASSKTGHPNIKSPSDDDIVQALNSTADWYRKKNTLSGRAFARYSVVQKLLEKLST